MQIEFYNRGCKAFFKKHGQRKMIEKTIAAAIAKEVATGMTKVKLASHQRINGQNVYEFRLNLGKIGSARLAFSVAGDQAVVYFITTHLQKATFSTEFDHLIGGI
ncbi:hypothetical protein QUW44_01685 [Limosilactobacillus pontis]|uniref:Addiction module toxin RelE n=1 Tax=Limosilactobacillus pontis TaxID=35787 RepID=A0ABT7UW45_9LACO|nr:hypothetical protein [Limosilactobacillus pontis]MDM8265884.1 hypothetical protein [Limosilactobacillus pontis]HJA74381.1 hypothetical protein [Candidatus Limosilactobacillus gallistercoris]